MAKPRKFIVSDVEISYNPVVKISERPKIGEPTHAYEILLSTWNLNKIELQEEFKIILLSRDNRVLGVSRISIGGTAGTVVDPKLIFVTALKANSAAIILAHNHPSGSLKPSTEDKTVTKRLVEAGKLLDIAVLDHLIITKYKFLSMKDEGHM